MSIAKIDEKYGDWTRHTWDIWLDDELVVNPGQLLLFLERRNLSLEHFMTLPVYRLNTGKMPWLKTLAPEKSFEERVIDILEKHQRGKHPQARHAGGRGKNKPLNPYTGQSKIDMAKGKREVLNQAGAARGFPVGSDGNTTFTEEQFLGELNERFKNVSPASRKAGETWYAEGNEFSDSVRGSVPLHDMNAGVAALSPLNEWDGNKRQAENWAKLSNREPPYDKKVLIDERIVSKNGKLDVANYESFAAGFEADSKFTGKDLRGEHYLNDLPGDVAALYVTADPREVGFGMDISSNLHMSNDAKAIEVMNRDNADDVLGGMKVRSFSNNLNYNAIGDDSVTIDTWQASILHGSKLSYAKEGSIIRSYTGTSSRYAYSASLTTKAAALAGYGPEETYKWQAIMWTEAHLLWPSE